MSISPHRRKQLNVALRSIAAIGGGYALAMYAGLWLQRGLNLDGRDSTQLVGMLFFLVYATAFIWAFAPISTRRAVLGIALPTLLLSAFWYTAGATA